MSAELEAPKTLALRKAERSDLHTILAFQNAIAPPRRRMPLSILEESLFAFSHRHGENTAVCLEGLEIHGVCGWVRGSAGEFFGAPVICGSEASASVLVDRLLSEAKGSKWIRVSCFPEEEAKRRVLALAGQAGRKRLFTTVSSRNAGSLALHRRLAIPEVERRKVFQKDLG